MLWDGREAGIGDGNTKSGLETTLIMHKKKAQQLSGWRGSLYHWWIKSLLK